MQSDAGGSLRVPLLPVSQEDPGGASSIESVASGNQDAGADSGVYTREVDPASPRQDPLKLSKQELADLTNQNDVASVRRLGGAEGIGARISNTVSASNVMRRSMPRRQDLLAAGAWVNHGFGLEASTEGNRKRRYGSNVVAQKMGAGATLGNFFVDGMMEDMCLVLIACAMISIVLALFDCQLWFDPSEDNPHDAACPQRPLWTLPSPIVLPASREANAQTLGFGKSRVRHVCLAWIDGLYVVLACAGMAFVKAASEIWRQSRFCKVLDLERMDIQPTVVRGGREGRIPLHRILVGDLVSLSVGDVIPADGVLVRSSGLMTDERMRQLDAKGHPLDEDGPDGRCVRKSVGSNSLLFAGCWVVDGEGLFLVTAVGESSNWGAVAADVRGEKLMADSPLRMQLDTLASKMMRVGLIVGALFLAVRLATYGVRMSFPSCYDGGMEICHFGYPGLNNQTKCVEEGYEWDAQYRRFSTIDVLQLMNSIAAACALVLLLAPHGVTAVISVFVASCYDELLAQRTAIRSMRALELAGNMTTLCIEKNAMVTSSSKRLTMAHICGVFHRGLASEQRGETLGGSSATPSRATTPALSPLPDAASPTDLDRSNSGGSSPRRLSQEEQSSSMGAAGGARSGRESPGSMLQHALSGQGVLHLGREGSWLRKELTATVADVLCKAVILNVRTQMGQRGGGLGVSHTLTPLQKRGEKFLPGSIDSGLEHAIESLGCDVHKTRRRMASSIVRRWPFCKEVSLASTLVEQGDGVGGRLFTTGAAEEVLKRCNRTLTPSGKVVVMGASQRADAMIAFKEMQAGGMTAIGVAYRDVPNPRSVSLDHGFGKHPSESADDLEEVLDISGWLASLPEHQLLLADSMIYIGLLGFNAPPRPEAPAAIGKCVGLGVSVRMVTGESLAVAKATAKRCGLLGGLSGVALTAAEWNSLSPASQREVLPELTVLAAAKPKDKLSLLQALQSAGEVVGCCCSHLEDVPVLEASDLSFATRYTGHEVVRQRADVVCQDDSCDSLVSAIVSGRCFHYKIRRFLQFRTVFNIVGPFLALFGAFAGVDMLYAIQMLWMKVVVDIGAVLALAPSPAALPQEDQHNVPYPVDKPLISKKARRDIGLLAGLQCAMLAAIILGGPGWITDCTYSKGEHKGCMAVLPNGQGKTPAGNYVYTLTLNAFVGTQMASLLASCLGRNNTGLDPCWHKTVTMTGAMLAAHLIIMQFGAAILKSVPIDVSGWFLCLFLAFISVFVSALQWWCEVSKMQQTDDAPPSSEGASRSTDRAQRFVQEL